MAPKFVIVENPNDFVKTINAGTDNLEERISANRFSEVLPSRNKPFKGYDAALATSEAYISITLVNKTNSISIEIYINDK